MAGQPHLPRETAPGVVPHLGVGRNSLVGDLGAFRWLFAEISLRNGGHFSHTTPSPSPSLALGTIHLENPLPPPLLPCTRRSPAAWAASQLAYVLTCGVGVADGCASCLVGTGVGFACWLWDTVN